MLAAICNKLGPFAGTTPPSAQVHYRQLPPRGKAAAQARSTPLRIATKPSSLPPTLVSIRRHVSLMAAGNGMASSLDGLPANDLQRPAGTDSANQPILEQPQTLEAVSVPPTEASCRLGARVEHLSPLRSGRLVDVVAEDLQLPHWFVERLVSFGAVYHCPVHPLPPRGAVVGIASLRLEAVRSARELALATYGNDPRLQVPRRAEAGTVVAPGHYIRVHVHPKRSPLAYGVDWRARVLGEGEEYVVVNKPAGVAAVPRVDNVRECCLTLFAEALALPRPLLVTHRLDNVTEGVLVLGKTKQFVSWFNNVLQGKRRKGAAPPRAALRKLYRTLTAAPPPVGLLVHHAAVNTKLPNLPAFTIVRPEPPRPASAGCEATRAEKDRDDNELRGCSTSGRSVGRDTSDISEHGEGRSTGSASFSGGAREPAARLGTGPAPGLGAARADVWVGGDAAVGDGGGGGGEGGGQGGAAGAALGDGGGGGEGGGQDVEAGAAIGDGGGRGGAGGWRSSRAVVVGGDGGGGEGTRCELEVLTVRQVQLTGAAAARWGAAAWEAEVELRTGRTHQIRAQLGAVGCPLLGDCLYEALAGRVDGLQLVADMQAGQPPTERVLEEPEEPIGLQAFRLEVLVPGPMGAPPVVFESQVPWWRA